MPLLSEAKNCDVSVKKNFRKISKKLGYTASPVFNTINITNAITASTSVFSKVCTVAAGLNVLRVTGLQTDGVAMTGTLRGAYIDVSNGSTAATGTIRAMELKARTEAPGDTGNDVNVLEGLSISADSKGHSVTIMRAAEFILDGKTGGTITEAVGLRIANNLQANKATTSYGLQIYRDSFDYTADIQLSDGSVINKGEKWGIGTSSPGSKLHINSTATASMTLLTLESDISNADEYNEILFKIAGGKNYGAIRSHVGSTNDSYMTFATTTDGGTLVQHMTIQHDGRVIIEDGDVWLFSNNSDARYVVGDTAAHDDYGYLRWDSTANNLRLGFNSSPFEDMVTIKKNGSVELAGSLTVGSIAVEGSDVDKFLVDSSGLIKYRTGTQVLSDIGGQTQGDVLDDLNTLGANPFTGDPNPDFLVGTSAGTLAWHSGATVRTSIGLGTGSYVQFLGIGIGIAPNISAPFRCYNDAVGVDTAYTGFYNYHRKTTGATDASDVFTGMLNHMILDDADSVVGNCRGTHIIFQQIQGDIGNGGSRFLTSAFFVTDLDGGKVKGSVVGFQSVIDQEIAHEVTGDIYGVYIQFDADGTVGGTTYMMYLAEASGVDYGIYQSGTGLNVLGGNLGIGITPQTKLTVEGIITLPKTSGSGIKIDTTTPTFGWADLQGNITNSKGATKPTEATYRGGITEFQFSAGDDAEIEYHIPHDHVPGTDIHLHVHWSHIGDKVNGGTLTFTVESSYAKGHNQAAFSAPVTGTFTGTASNTQYQHIVSETQYSASAPSGLQIDTDDLEPDGVILMRLEMTTNNITVSSGLVPDPFLHHIDVHYQTTGLIGTKQKAPDFWT